MESSEVDLPKIIWKSIGNMKILKEMVKECREFVFTFCFSRWTTWFVLVMYHSWNVYNVRHGSHLYCLTLYSQNYYLLLMKNGWICMDNTVYFCWFKRMYQLWNIFLWLYMHSTKPVIYVWFLFFSS